MEEERTSLLYPCAGAGRYTRPQRRSTREQSRDRTTSGRQRGSGSCSTDGSNWRSRKSNRTTTPSSCDPYNDKKERRMSVNNWEIHIENIPLLPFFVLVSAFLCLRLRCCIIIPHLFQDPSLQALEPEITRTRETYQTSAVLAMTVPKTAPETNPVMNRTAMLYIEKLYDWYNAYK